jgi:hypothetical protein
MVIASIATFGLPPFQNSTPDILFVGDGFQMVGADTRAIPAQMVNHYLRWKNAV